MRRRMLVAVTVASLLMGAAPAAVAETPPAGVTVAVASPNKALYAWPAGGSGWVNLGGALATAPAVVHDGTRTHFVAMGVNQRLYHRTDTTGWAALAPVGFSCTHVGAGLSADRASITVGCRGGNAKLYALTFPTDVDVPYAPEYVGLGGVIEGTPAVVTTTTPLEPGLSEGITFVVRGGSYTTPTGGQSTVYARTISQGWARAGDLLGACTDAPGIAVRQDKLVAACQTAAGVQVGWRDAASSGGYVVAGKAVGSIAPVISSAGASLTVMGGNSVVYTRTLELVGTAPTSAWTRLGGVAVGGAGAAAAPVTATTTRITDGNAVSANPDISADGRYVAFSSGATNLDDTVDTNSAYDVFVHDQTTGDITRITNGDDDSWGPALSEDGSVIAFTSRATDLVPGDENGQIDAFVYDTSAAEFTRISVAANGAATGGGGRVPSISADGRYVAFTSDAADLVAGDTNNAWDVFVHDRDTGQTTRITGGGDDSSSTPDISANGRYVTFESVASNLIPGGAPDTDGNYDVYVYDLQTGQIRRVTNGNSMSFSPTISADGGSVTFTSKASNLVDGNSNGLYQIYVWDAQSGDLSAVTAGNDGSDAPAISDDGRTIAFASDADNLLPIDDGVSGRQIFVHDRDTGLTTRITSGDGSIEPSLSADGRYVAFTSIATDLVPGDLNGFEDIFVHDRG